MIVGYDDRLAMEPTLEAALWAVFKPGTTPPPALARSATPTPPEEGTTTSAREHYRSALDALRGGDWSGFGREMEALGKALEP